MPRYALTEGWLSRVPYPRDDCGGHGDPDQDIGLYGGGSPDAAELYCTAGHRFEMPTADLMEGYAVRLPDVTEVPTDALRALVEVAAHVSGGREAAFVTPYPDAKARVALGALDDAGILDEFREG